MDKKEKGLLETVLCDQYCNLGMTNALAFLQMVLSSVVSVDRIIYATTDLITHTNNQLANIDREKNSQVQVDSVLVKPNKVEVFPLDPTGGLEAFILDNSQQGDAQTFLMRENHARFKSMLAVTLFENREVIHAIGLMSYEKHAYTRSTAETLFSITRALAQEVKKSTEGQEILYSIEFPPYISSATQVLKLSRDLSHVVELAEKIAPTDTPVLITGETGVGQEVLAEMIREHSKRAHGPFVKVNCGALPETLIESSFFGYEKGAFTGAFQSHAGYFEQANGGTLFLDEIGDLSLQAQIRLLRVLENHEIQRIGSEKTKKVDFRLLVATNKNLKKAIENGLFREDLYYRISHFPVHVPALRERKHDIPLLVNYFLQNKAKELGFSSLPQASKTEMQKLLDYAFPGNVRELLHILERSLLLSADKNNQVHKLVFALDQEPIHPPTPHGLENFFAEMPRLDELEEKYIHFVLKKAGGKLTGPDSASALLGIHPNTLRARLKKNGETPPRKRGRPVRV